MSIIKLKNLSKKIKIPWTRTRGSFQKPKLKLKLEVLLQSENQKTTNINGVSLFDFVYNL
jgi:hypothetical protein